MATSTLQLPSAPSYGLTAPTVEDVHESILHILGEDAAVVWEHLGREAPNGSVEQLITVMLASSDRLIALLGRSQQIRLACYHRLRAVDDLVAATD